MIQSLRLSTLFLALFVLLIAAYSYKRADSTPPFQLAKVKSIELDWPGTPTSPELQDSPTAETQVFQTPEKDIYMLLKAPRRSSSGLDVECAAFIRTLTEP